MIKTSEGLTLLEVLLSVTILAIVLTSFLTLFPTAATFNQKSNETLSGINLGKEKIVILENIVREDIGKSIAEKNFLISNSDMLLSLENINQQPLFSLLNFVDINVQSDTILMETEDGNIHSQIVINRKPDLASEYYLYRVSVVVSDTENNDLTNVYGYLSIPSK